MYEFYQFFNEIRDKPLNLIVVAVLLFIIDKFGRRLITSQVKRLFHVDDSENFKQYTANQRRIERKVDLLLQERGIPCGVEETAATGLKSSSTLWRLFSEKRLSVLTARLYTRRKSEMKINKAWLSGVIAYIFGQLALQYGFTWNDAWSDTITEMIIAFVLPVLVAWMNRTKKKKEVEQEDDFTELTISTESAE